MHAINIKAGLWRELNIVFEFMLMSTCSLLAYFFSSRNQWFTIHG